MNLDENQQVCRNCEAPLGDADRFCPQCSQKNTTGKESVGTFISEFISTTFNLDSKIFKSITSLFIPGKLTKEYFRGKHKSYYHPLRFFLVVGLAFFAILASHVNQQGAFFSMYNDSDKENIYQQKTLATIDSLKQVSDSTSIPAFDSLIAVLNNKLNVRFDSFSLPTVMYKIVNTDGREILMAKKDLIELDHEALFEKYQVAPGRFNRLQFQQIIKIIKDGQSFSSFLVGNIIWATLFMMLVLALVLKLFYYRRKNFYVEHLIFSLHIHTFLLLLLFLNTIYTSLRSSSLEGFSLLILLAFVIYTFIALKKYYQQSYPKTILKFVVITIIYPFLFLFILVFGLVLGVYFF